MVIAAALRAFPFLFHKAALRLLLKTLVLTLLLFGALAIGLWAALHGVRLWVGWRWGGGLAEATATALVVLALGWLLFRAAAMAVMGLFADDIIVAVEAQSYPQAAAAARSVGVSRGLRFALRSIARTLGWNLLALPAYIALIVTGIGTIALFLAINAYLLGRDLADMVEPRHPDLLRIAPLGRWLMGLVSALLFLTPILNLLAPIWSAAMAVHMLHGVRRKPA